MGRTHAPSLQRSRVDRPIDRSTDRPIATGDRDRDRDRQTASRRTMTTMVASTTSSMFATRIAVKPRQHRATTTRAAIDPSLAPPTTRVPPRNPEGACAMRAIHHHRYPVAARRGRTRCVDARLTGCVRAMCRVPDGAAAGFSEPTET